MMRRFLFPLALALSLLAIPAGLAATQVTPANGNDVLLPDGAVYQLADDGAYHWIPDVATGNAMHLDWNNLQEADSLDGPVASALPSVVPPSATFVAATTRAVAPTVPAANGNDVVLPDGTVYQLGDDGTYHLIPNVATGNAMHLDWNALQPVDSLDAEVGAPIPSVT